MSCQSRLSPAPCLSHNGYTLSSVIKSTLWHDLSLVKWAEQEPLIGQWQCQWCQLLRSGPMERQHKWMTWGKVEWDPVKMDDWKSTWESIVVLLDFDYWHQFIPRPELFRESHFSCFWVSSVLSFFRFCTDLGTITVCHAEYRESETVRQKWWQSLGGEERSNI